SIAAFGSCVLCINACSQTPALEHNLPSNLYIDSLYRFSLSIPNFTNDPAPLRAAMDADTVNFLMVSVFPLRTNATLSDLRNRLHYADSVQAVTLIFDSTLKANGNDAVSQVWNKIHTNRTRNMAPSQTLQLDVLHGDKDYCFCGTYPIADSLRRSGLFREALKTFKFIDSLGMDSTSVSFPRSKAASVFIDSLYRFSISLPNFMDSTEDAPRGSFPLDSLTNILVVVHQNDVSFSEYRNQERKRLNTQVHVVLDSIIQLNGNKGILWECNLSLPGRGDYNFNQFDVLDNHKAYSILAFCPTSDYPNRATALRNALMSFKRF
ncbi:MAG TPA: hypothetical protein VFX22_05815, partial [Candidatus Kapabacteria bacterium]|nr:hypothetical protein [Candidatus Kapabacteria bacterium]